MPRRARRARALVFYNRAMKAAAQLKRETFRLGNNFCRRGQVGALRGIFAALSPTTAPRWPLK